MALTLQNSQRARALWLRRLNELRELWRLRRLLPREPGTTMLLGKPLRIVAAGNFLFMRREIFLQQVYRFAPAREAPVILDCGANIGLATLYWKLRHPAARIIAFEPDPAIFEALAWNCCHWDLTGVDLVNAAVWTAAGEMSFWPEGSDAGRLLPEDCVEIPARITVNTVRLRDYLGGPVDLLKLDIEGAEMDVLQDCADTLQQVDHLFVEYHSFINRPQRLHELLQILCAAGFRYYLQPQIYFASPFVQRLNNNGMDQTINIFAYRGGSTARPTTAR